MEKIRPQVAALRSRGATSKTLDLTREAGEAFGVSSGGILGRISSTPTFDTGSNEQYVGDPSEKTSSFASLSLDAIRGQNVGKDVYISVTDSQLWEQLTVVIEGVRYRPVSVLQMTDVFILADYNVTIFLIPGGFFSNPVVSKLGLHTVVEIEIKSGEMDVIPDSFFTGLKSVNTLTISQTDLSAVTGSQAFSGLDSLQRLYLINNKIQAIGKAAFLGLESLESFDLRGNELVYLDTGLFCPLVGLKEFKGGLNSEDVSSCVPV